MYEQGSKEGPVQPQLPGSGVPWSSIKDTFPDLPSHITTQMTSLEKPMQQQKGKKANYFFYKRKTALMS